MCRSSGVPTTQGMQGPWALDGDLGPGKNSGTQREPELHSKLGFPAGAGSVTCERHLEDSPRLLIPSRSLTPPRTSLGNKGKSMT